MDCISPTKIICCGVLSNYLRVLQRPHPQSRGAEQHRRQQQTRSRASLLASGVLGSVGTATPGVLTSELARLCVNTATENSSGMAEVFDEEDVLRGV